MISTAQEAIDLLAYGEHNEVIRAALAFIVHAQHQQGVQLQTLITQGEHMSTTAITLSQSVADLIAGDTALKAAVTQVLQVVASQAAALTAASGDPAQIEAIAQDIQAQTASILAAINPPVPTPTSAPAEVPVEPTPAA